MKHITALIIKFVMLFVVMAVIQGLLTGWPLGTVFITSIILTLVAYIVGDLWILPAGGNLTASSADFGISVILIWGLGSLLLGDLVFVTGPGISALVIAVGEWFFHLSVMPKVFHQSKRTSPAR